MRSRRRSSGSLALVAFVLFLAAGCKSADTSAPGRGTELPKVIYPLRLSRDLRTFARNYSSRLAGVMSTIAANTTDRAVRELTLQVKLQGIPVLFYATSHPDVRIAFIETWVACVQGRMYLTEGAGKAVFGEGQPLAVEVLQELEEEFILIGEEHFGEELVESGAARILEFARNHPLDNTFNPEIVGSDAGPSSSWQTTFSEYAGMPLAPFRGLEGVSDTASAIQAFSQTLANFSRVIRELPNATRWQTELVLLELDSLPSLVDARKSLERMSTATESFAETAEKLPSELRRELGAVIEASEKSQEGFRATMAEARKTAEEVKASLKEAGSTARSVSEAGVKLAETAKTWEATANAVNAVLATYKDIASAADDEAEPQADEGPPAIELNTQSAVAIEKAAVEVRALLQDIESGKIDKAIGERAAELLDRITIRALIVIAAGLVGLILYRLATAGLRRKA